MFKKIFIGLVFLVLIGAAAACGKAQVTPTPTPGPTPTPPINEVVDPETGAISLDSFVERAKGGEYKEGQKVEIRGRVEKAYFDRNNGIGELYLSARGYTVYGTGAGGRDANHKLGWLRWGSEVVVGAQFHFIDKEKKSIHLWDIELLKVLQ